MKCENSDIVISCQFSQRIGFKNISPLKVTTMIKKHFIFGEWCSFFNNVKFPSLNFRLFVKSSA